MFFGDDVDRTTDGIGTVKHGGRSLDDFNTLNSRRINQNRSAGHGLMFGNALTVNHEDSTERAHSSNADALEALAAVVLYLNARNVIEHVGDCLGA